MRQAAIYSALLAVAVGATLGATVFRADIAQATGLAQSVTVNNTAANPVPVHEQGSVSVNASQVGPWSVRDRDNPALQPYTDHVQVVVQAGDFFGDEEGAAVPAGKRLVIEEVTANAITSAGQFPQFNFAAPSTPGDLYYLPMTPAGSEVQNAAFRYVTNELTRIYLEPGERFRAILLRPADNTGGSAFLDVRISGYLIDA